VKKPMEPTITDDGRELRIEHPAFAMIGASRVTGKTHLHGSDFVHHNFVRIAIRPGDVRRDLSQDWYSATSLTPLIEVDLSEAQWASFVSTMNVGYGVPCTLNYHNGEEVPSIPAPVQKSDATFKKEMTETMQEGITRLNDLVEMIEALPISARKKDELRTKAKTVGYAMNSNVNFVAKQFGEHVETTVEKAKIEVDAYINARVQQAGLQALRGPAEEAPLALESKE
jgi:hypothetical protein